MPDRSPEQWQKLRQLFDAALDQTPGSRAAYLDQACSGDPELRAEVEALMQSHEQEDDFLESLTLAGKELLASIETESLQEKSIGPYHILKTIGSGGMGSVFLAARSDDQYQKKVAIKLVRQGMGTADVLTRFRQERQILANLDHPNIAHLLDGGTTERGLPYLVMDYVDGIEIDKYSDAQKLSTFERLKLFQTICSAVHYAHQNLVIHRDIKPGNILVTANGVPKLLDFGIAKVIHPDPYSEPTATASILRIMTPEYASPEQVRGQTITTASDIYSLGVVLYELLTGHRPYRMSRSSPVEIERAVCESEPAKPSTMILRTEEVNASGKTIRITPESVSEARSDSPQRLRQSLSGDLDNIVLRALQKDSNRRYASAEQFSEDIRRYMDGLPVIAQKDTLGYRLGKFVRRHKAGVAAASFIFLILIGGVFATAWEAHVAEQQRELAERRFNEVRKLAHSVLFDYDSSIAELAGSTPLRRRLVHDALQYLDGLAKESGGDRSIRRELASAYEKVGDVQGNPYQPNLGDSAGAMVSYKTSLALRKELVAEEPSNIEVQRELADSYDKIGDMMELSHNMDAASSSYREALTLRQSIFDRNPKEPESVRQLALSFEMVGEMRMKAGDNPGALKNYQKALDLRKSLVSLLPTEERAHRSLAVSYIKMADGLAKMGQKQEAVDNSRNAVVILRDLASHDPNNGTTQRDLSYVLNQFGELLSDNGNFDESAQNFQASLDIREKILAADATNKQAQRDVGISLGNIGNALAHSGKAKEALETYRHMLEIFQNLSQADPSNVAARRDLAEAGVLFGDVYVALAEGKNIAKLARQQYLLAAKDWYRKSLSSFQQMQKENLVRGSDDTLVDTISQKIATCDSALK